MLGWAGLAWGIGLHPSIGDGPVKEEGDGRSPAGIFAFGSAFGYAPPEQAAFIKMPYTQATSDLDCVDDPSSSFYNQLVHSDAVQPDWYSAEPMRRSDSLYRWGLVVQHNTKSPQPGAGSCIFMHIWRDSQDSTVGCTATDESQVKDLLGWLDPAKSPRLVQLPQAEYDAHRTSWSLP